jgi:hypothetical protein
VSDTRPVTTSIFARCTDYWQPERLVSSWGHWRELPRQAHAGQRRARPHSSTTQQRVHNVNTASTLSSSFIRHRPDAIADAVYGPASDPCRYQEAYTMTKQAHVRRLQACWLKSASRARRGHAHLSMCTAAVSQCGIALYFKTRGTPVTCGVQTADIRRKADIVCIGLRWQHRRGAQRSRRCYEHTGTASSFEKAADRCLVTDARQTSQARNHTSGRIWSSDLIGGRHDLPDSGKHATQPRLALTDLSLMRTSCYGRRHRIPEDL